MLALAALAALLPALVAGQDSSAAVASAAASVPSCALVCTLQLAGSSACGGVTNVTCLCTNADFQRDVYQCYVNSCSGSDLQAAEAYGAQTCASAGITLDTTAVPSGVTGVSTSAGGSSTSGASSGTTTPAPSSAGTSSAASSSSAPASSASPTGAAANAFARGNVLMGAVAIFAGVAGLVTIL